LRIPFGLLIVRTPSIAAPSLKVNTGPEFVLIFLEFGLFLIGNTWPADALKANQLHAPAAEIDVLHHLLPRRKVSDVLAMRTGRGMRLYLSEDGISYNVDPARIG